MITHIATDHVYDAEGKMIKLSTMQKLFGLSLILSIFTVVIGIYSVSNLSNLSSGIDNLYNIHVKGLNVAQGINITILRLVREEKNLILTNESGEIQRCLQQLTNEQGKLASQMQTLPQYFASREGKALCEKLIQSITAWLALHKKVIELGKTSDATMNEKAQELSNTQARQAMRDVTQAIQAVVDLKLKRAGELNDDSTRMYETSRLITIIGIIASVLVGLGLGFTIARNMLRQLGDEPASLSKLALAIAGGNLDARFDPARKEQGVFGAMKNMVGTLKTKIAEAEQKGLEAAEESKKAQQATLEAEEARKQAERAKAEGMLQAARQLESVVGIVNTASEQLSTQIEQSSRGADEQSSRVRETATAMEEMNATVLEVARNAQQAADASSQTRQKALEGSNIVSDAVKGIETVRDQSLAIKEDMNALGKQAEGIGQVMNVIADIADQTNLLALNAAIEAARAGDAGRGFAVVADEVRKLAEKTMSATQEVGQAIRDIQEGTRKNIENVDKSSISIESATSLSVKSGESLQQILTLVEHVNDQVQSIATASEQQSAASEEINQSVEQVATISAETAQAMEQASSAVSELLQQSQVLQGLISEMKAQG